MQVPESETEYRQESSGRDITVVSDSSEANFPSWEVWRAKCAPAKGCQRRHVSGRVSDGNVRAPRSYEECLRLISW